MKKNKLLIYLAELAHNGFGLSLNTVPLGIGCVGAYSKKIFGDEIELRLFRQIEDLMSALSDHPPHIVGFGYFTWNDNLTLAASARVKELSPDSLIVLGGLNISFEGWENSDNYLNSVGSRKRKLCAQCARDYDLTLLRNHPEVDVIVHGDGEVPFTNVVRTFMDSRDRLEVRSKQIGGCSALLEGQLVTGKPVTPLLDLDVIPSPYLTGLFSEFLVRFQLVPQIETVRGCPYDCTYCTIGGNINTLRKHSLEYAKEEILFLRDNSPNRVLRIADSNWGILRRDVELAEFIRELHDTSGYPSSLRVYYAEKGPFENVRRMAEKLKALLPFNMSFQTLTEEVLSNIKRKNMPISKVKEIVEFAHNNNITASTELISGLPGETYESFKNVFQEVVELNFDSVYVGNLYLTKNSDLYTEIARKRYGIRTMYALLGNDVTQVSSRYVFEVDEVVVESNTMSVDDFWELHKFNFFIFSCYGAAFLKEIIMHCLNHEITALDLYDELFGIPDKYPFFNRISMDYLENVKTKYFDTREELGNAITKSVRENGSINEFSIYRQFFYYLGTVLSEKNKQRFVAEFVKAARSIYDRKGKDSAEDAFTNILDLLANLETEVIISPLEDAHKESVTRFSYDVVAWAKDNYEKPLLEYRLNEPMEFCLSIRNRDEHRDLYERAKGLDKIEKYLLYFTTVVSSNMRRFINYS